MQAPPPGITACSLTLSEFLLFSYLKTLETTLYYGKTIYQHLPRFLSMTCRPTSLFKIQRLILRQCCQMIFQKVAQTGVKRRTNALPRRAHFCVLNFAHKIGKNVLKLVFCNMLHLQKHISTPKSEKSWHVTEIFLTVLAPKRKAEYQKVPFSGHFHQGHSKKRKISLWDTILSHNYAYFLYNNLYKKVAPHPRTRVKKALQKAHRRAQRKQGAHGNQKALQCAT